MKETTDAIIHEIPPQGSASIFSFSSELQQWSKNSTPVDHAMFGDHHFQAKRLSGHRVGSHILFPCPRVHTISH